MLAVVTILLIGGLARSNSGIVERPRSVAVTRGRALAAFLIDMVGGATPIVLVMTERVPRTTATQAIAIFFFIYLSGGRSGSALAASSCDEWLRFSRGDRILAMRAFVDRSVPRATPPRTVA